MNPQATSEGKSDRICGSCTACCKTHAVPELRKLGGKWCLHVTTHRGCSIYLDRPYSCRKYSCAWLAGFGHPSFRPDRLKVVIDYLRIKFEDKEVPTSIFSGVEEGAIDLPEVQHVLSQLLAAGHVIFYVGLGGKSKHLFFPRDSLSREEQVRFMATVEDALKSSRTLPSEP